ncbi:MYXO-CTERM sorting domain-containing protein [Sorangium sp. So ce1335]|uniref:MYXO-CTERM sorting domain-containing protein n=1 Tax=Sorangium sp. So ce1335 TaxID=3133335 RepID=UPI003F5F72EE
MLTTRERAAALLGLLVGLGLLSRDAAGGIDDLQGTKPGELPNNGEFSSSETCYGCHRALPNTSPPQSKDYMPFDTWAGTMMANAWRDPVFTAALTVAEQDMPGVGTFCVRCHSPIGFVRGRATPPYGSAFDPDPSLEGIVDGQGVGCDVCHRATTSPAPNAPYILGNAQLVFGHEIDPEEQKLVKYGPYENVISENHGGKEEPAMSSSRFCGQCHQVTNPEVMLRDLSGKPTTVEFPLDTTFEEWASSDFRDRGASPKSCIDCHMRKRDGEWTVAKEGVLRTDPRDHLIVGGNHWGIQAVMAADPTRAAEYATSFQLALDRTLESLASAASVTLVEAPQQAEPGDEITVTVRVENLTGHKFPTGYAESRRAWIAVFLVDEAGVERPLLGGYDADTGEIQHAPPTHEYRAVHGRWNSEAGVGEKEEHLALHDMIISDTRIPPKGFVASQTTQATQEIDFSDGNGGYRNYDEASFTLTVPADAFGAQTLSARVYYQSMTREYVEFLRSANVTDNKGEELMAIYEETGEAPPILVDNEDAPLDLGAPPDTTGSNGASSSAGNGAGGSGGGGAGGDPTGGAADGARDDGGCGCRTPGSGHDRWLPAALAALALASAAARRRRAPPSP